MANNNPEPTEVAATPPPKQEQKIDPWNVYAPGGIDYDKLIDEFGSKKISPELIARVESITGKPAHPWLKRGYFFLTQRFGTDTGCL